MSSRRIRRRATARIVEPTGSTDLASLFKCSVCSNHAVPRVHQCQSGHLICSKCRSKLERCPTCSGFLGNIRNLAMEKVASNVIFPCNNAGNGCTKFLNNIEKAAHEETCKFRPYTCPCPWAICQWKGSLAGVIPHMRQSHTPITNLDGEDIVFMAIDIGLPGEMNWVMMQSCHGEHFMLILEKQDKPNAAQQYFGAVQLFGSKEDAEKYAYKFELNGHQRRVSWEGIAGSIQDGVPTANSSSGRLIFDSSIVRSFAENGNLAINMTIYVVDSNE